MKATLIVVSAAGAALVGWKVFQQAKQQVKLFEKAKEPHSPDEDSSASQAEQQQAEDPEVTSRRLFIREMAWDAWSAHCNYAWGHDTVHPHKQQSFNFWFGPCSGHTMITAMSTLWIMDYKDDFRRAQRWVENRFDLSQAKDQWDVKETMEDYLGSFLACYALTGEQVFLEKATLIGEVLKPAYKTVTGLPNWRVCPKTALCRYRPETSLSDASAGLLELPLLADLTGDSTYRCQAAKMRSTLYSKQTTSPLFLKTINHETAEWTDQPFGHVASLLQSTSAFYTGLLKSYIQSAGSETTSLELYKVALDAVEKAALFTTSSQTGLTYARDLNITNQSYSDYTEFSGAYLGGMLALGAQAMDREAKKIRSAIKRQVERDRINRHQQLAQELTETYYQASRKTPTGLAPFRIYFNAASEATNEAEPDFAGFYLSPELAESYFILWRLTHDRKYRDMAWQLAQAIHTHCRTESGYSQLESTQTVPTDKMHIQPAAFLGATLKYLYLTFSDDSVLPLEQWVFNGAGQPLPIRGSYKCVRSGFFGCTVS